MRMIKKISAIFLAVVLLISIIPTVNINGYAEQTTGNVVRDVVGEGIVLLKNKNNVLPLNQDSKVAVFGKGQIYTSGGYTLGGGGSGTMYLSYTPDGPGDHLVKLANEGKLSVYTPLYEAYKADANYTPTAQMYDDASVSADTAIMYISRSASEGSDISATSWYLNWKEEEILKEISAHFENVIVFINAPSMMSTDWSLDGNEYGIDVDSLLLMHLPGEYGLQGMTDVLFGDVNPSGKLVDTYAKDLYDYPSTESYSEDPIITKYTEDIFVGYRYFETFAKDKVAYEFGFGMSYTDFEITTDSVTNDSEKITVKATVKNTGNIAGKETVQLYFSSPQKGTGDAVLSKAAIELAGYKKTELLAPGQSQTVEISLNINDMASFDDLGITGNKSCYVLEAGEYSFYLGNSVRNNTKIGSHMVDSLIVTEQLSQNTDTTLDKRLEADGSYSDPSVPLLSENQYYIYGNKVTTMEGEVFHPSYSFAATKENFGTKAKFYDGVTWHTMSEGVSVGNLQTRVGQHLTYSLYVGEKGKYNLGFILSNGQLTTSNEDVLGLSVSYDNGSTWKSVEGFALDSKATGSYKSVTGNQWFNFTYSSADFQNKQYSVNLEKGHVLLRFTVLDGAKSSNTNIEKFFFIPENVSFGIVDACKIYGAEVSFKTIISPNSETWLEGEDYTSASGCAAEAFSSGKGFLYNGQEYKSVGAGTVIGRFQYNLGNYVTYQVYAENAGAYNLGLIMGNGSEAEYDVNDALKISVSTDGGTTYTEQTPAIDSPNTANAGTGYRWWNMQYCDEDFDGNKYAVNLAQGINIIKIESTENALTDGAGCVNIDKMVFYPEGYEFTEYDAFDYYKIDYIDSYISSDKVTWFEGESATAKGNSVNTENFADGKGFLYDGSSYVSIGAGTVLGNFDKKTDGYAQYTFHVKEAKKYDVAFIVARGANLDDTNGNDVLTISYSSDGGTTWTEAPVKVDVEYTKNAGTGAFWWNFRFNDADYAGNRYTVELPKGEILLRFTNTANAISCGGPNIDKFALIPDGVSLDQEMVNIYYGISTRDMVTSDKPYWVEAENHSGISGLKTEKFALGSAFMYDPAGLKELPAGMSLGNFNAAVGNYVDYKLYFEEAGTYRLIFAAGNGTSANSNANVEDVFSITTSSDGGESFSEPIYFDSINTRLLHSKRWFNFRYHGEDFQGNQYLITVPKGEVTLRFTSAENAVPNTQGSVNMDKFAIIPATVSFTEDDALTYYDEFIKNENKLEIDFDADNYVGITYADILSGEHTWNELIAQMSYGELIDLTGGHYGSWSSGWTGMIGFSSDDTAHKYGIYSADTFDGPAGIRTKNANKTWIPNAVLQASTWNPDLLYKLGLLVADEALEIGADMWLAPGMNIHRSPLGGRNFEYYSEDPFITGTMAAGITNAVQSKGVAITIKHVVGNERELNRKEQNSLMSERALREIYLEGFRIVIEEANPWCMMTSYNKVNNVYTSADKKLIKGIIRGEWGYKGLIMSDWDEWAAHLDQVLAGNNAKMVSLDKAALQNAVIMRELTREQLEENAYYILSNIAKMPDTALYPSRITTLSLGKSTVDMHYYVRRQMFTRFVYEDGNYLAPGQYRGTFYEYKVDAPVAGEYQLDLSYVSTADLEYSCDFYVNDTLVSGLNTAVTADGNCVTVGKITLPKGVSTIRLVQTSSTTIHYDSFSLTSLVEVKEGDVTLDDTVDVRDLVYTNNIVCGITDKTDMADLNKDGVIDYKDNERIRVIIISSTINQ